MLRTLFSAKATKPASALLIATFVAMVLGASAAALLMQTRSARAASGETLRLDRVRLEAQALMAEALIRLDQGDPMPARGELFAASDGGRVLRQDATGLVDINAAEPERLAALLTALHVEPEQAAILADRIADWRDGDDLKRLHGAEAPDYEAQHLPAPRNGPFEVETELLSVLGITPALMQCIAPYVTTYSGGADIDPTAAPDFLRALWSASDAAPNNVAGAPLGRVIILSADAPISEHASLELKRWIRLTGDARRPFVTHRAAETLVSRDAPAQPATCNRTEGA